MVRRSMSLYPWLNPVVARLSHALQMNRLHHAILLQGRTGMGKSELAGYIASGLLCHSGNDLVSCGRCKSCLLFHAGNHPDCLMSDSGGGSIGVDDIRKGGEFVHQTSQISRRRIWLIQHGERLTEAGANALLKTLEEPNAGVHLLLTCDKPTLLLATIRSRCIKITINAPDQAVVFQWLQSRFGDLGQIPFEMLLTLAGNAPLSLAQWLEDGKLADIEQATGDFQQWLNGRLNGVQYQQRLAQSPFELQLFEHLLIEHFKDVAIRRQDYTLTRMQLLLDQISRFNHDGLTISGQNKSLALLSLLTRLRTDINSHP